RAAAFPTGLWRRLGALGAFGLRVPAAYGGADVDCVTAGLAVEAIATGDPNICYGMLNACFAGDLLRQFAAESVQRRWLPPLAAGEAYLCVGLTEPHCGSDAAAITTRAVRQGEHYVLTGEKAGMTGLMAGAAAIVFAKTDPGAGARGVSAFLVPLDSPGLSRTPYCDLGARTIGRGSLFLDAVRVPAENLIGPENGAFARVMRTFDYTRALIGLQCLGAARTAIAETVAYVKNRAAFGRPISTNQGVSFPIAEWSARIEAARWLCLRTLWLRDQGLPHTSEAAMCKLLGPDIAAEAIHACLILHGHYGYTTDFPIEQRLRDAVGLQIADGTPQIQKLIIAREIFGRDFV
ncbi:MAG: acyl-CoA dehydrogenase family protein, partial [Methylobacteriaceae bacterium]|nr:acyl-CoA dehydrogenase family protein [Methylobacteriaceae bacterium]